MSPSGKSKDVQAILDELFEQKVPPGNPIAESYQQRSHDMSQAENLGVMGAGTLGATGLVELLEGNPLALLLLTGAATSAGGALGGNILRDRYQKGADMWFNNFGTGNPNQGMPGSPSGPTYRRHK